MKKQFNRSGVRRGGDDYQDLIAAELLLEWLANPSRYLWVEIEAENSGALDDVIAARTDGSFIYRQVKFTVDPEKYSVSWEYLTKRERGNSLLQKWSESLENLKKNGPIHEASLVTNRGVLPDFLQNLDCYRSGLVADTSPHCMAS